MQILSPRNMLSIGFLGLGVFALSAQSSIAKVVSETELSKYCAGEASAKLGVRPNYLIMLPVEKTHGKFHVYGQTDDAQPKLFECTFDGRRNYLGVEVKANHDHGNHAANGAPKAAINKCLQMLGAAATVEKVSALSPGFSEIIIKEKGSTRRVACTVPDDGSEIEDWVEMN